jgi:tRNA threonylcarbamoyladenosine biosynthesis protein TsaB
LARIRKFKKQRRKRSQEFFSLYPRRSVNIRGAFGGFPEMLLLVTDTSGRNGSVALARAEMDSAEYASKIDVIETVALAGGTFSAQLVPQIAALLAKHGFNKAQIDAFIVVSGPGSFTGLRVGLAAIKALAEILRKPIVPVSLLELIALASGQQSKVLSVLDAGRGEVYAGEYEVAGESARMVREELMTKKQVLALARGVGGATTIATNDESFLQMAQEEKISVVRVDYPEACQIAVLGLRKLQKGDMISPEELDANYIRRTDAEIFAKQS